MKIVDIKAHAKMYPDMWSSIAERYLDYTTEYSVIPNKDNGELELCEWIVENCSNNFCYDRHLCFYFETLEDAIIFKLFFC